MVYIADTAKVDVGSDVLDEARVEDRAALEITTLRDYAKVSGNAKLRSSLVSGEAKVMGSAQVLFSTISEKAVVKDNTVCVRCHVSDRAEIRGNAHVGKLQIEGDSHIFGEANLQNNSFFKVTLEGSCKFGGNATFDDLVTDEDFVNKYGADKLFFHSSSIENWVVLADVWDMG